MAKLRVRSYVCKLYPRLRNAKDDVSVTVRVRLEDGQAFQIEVPTLVEFLSVMAILERPPVYWNMKTLALESEVTL